MFEGSGTLHIRGVDLGDSILSGFALLFGMDESLLELFGFSVFFSEFLKLATSFIGDAGVSNVGASDLLVEGTSFVVLSLALSTGLLSLVQIQLLELSVN